MKFDSRFAKGWRRPTLEFIIAAADHPKHAGAMQELALPAPFIFRPELEGAGGELRIGLIRTIGAAHDASFAAGRRARVSRSPCIE